MANGADIKGIEVSDIDVTYQFGATGNTLRVREFNIER